MNILYFLVPMALLLAAAGVAGFIWSVRSGQFDDVETPAMRVLFDEELRGEDKRPSSSNTDIGDSH